MSTYEYSIESENFYCKYAKGKPSVSGKEFHDYDEVVLFLEGEAKFVSKNTQTTLSLNDIVWISREQFHQFIVLDELVLDSVKTKGLVEVLKAVKADSKKVVVALSEANANVELAGRNIPNVLVQEYSHISVYEMMNANTLVLTKAVVEKYEEVLK